MDSNNTDVLKVIRKIEKSLTSDVIIDTMDYLYGLGIDVPVRYLPYYVKYLQK